MSISSRGSIKYLDRYKQLISYEGMVRHRGITPTDIDGFIDYSGNVFLYLECKLLSKELDIGQRKALENVVKSHDASDKKGCAAIFKHNSKPDEIIMAKDQYVSEIYLLGGDNYSWIQVFNEKITLLDFIERFENWCIKQGYKI